MNENPTANPSVINERGSWNLMYKYQKMLARKVRLRSLCSLVMCLKTERFSVDSDSTSTAHAWLFVFFFAALLMFA